MVKDFYMGAGLSKVGDPEGSSKAKYYLRAKVDQGRWIQNTNNGHSIQDLNDSTLGVKSHLKTGSKYDLGLEQASRPQICLTKALLFRYIFQCTLIVIAIAKLAQLSPWHGMGTTTLTTGAGTNPGNSRNEQSLDLCFQSDPQGLSGPGSVANFSQNIEIEQVFIKEVMESTWGLTDFNETMHAVQTNTVEIFYKALSLIQSPQNKLQTSALFSRLILLEKDIGNMVSQFCYLLGNNVTLYVNLLQLHKSFFV